MCNCKRNNEITLKRGSEEAKRLDSKHLSINICDCRMCFGSGTVNALPYMLGINKRQERFPELSCICWFFFLFLPKKEKNAISLWQSAPVTSKNFCILHPVISCSNQYKWSNQCNKNWPQVCAPDGFSTQFSIKVSDLICKMWIIYFLMGSNMLPPPMFPSTWKGIHTAVKEWRPNHGQYTLPK